MARARVFSAGAAIAALSVALLALAACLNPQPLPPGESNAFGSDADGSAFDAAAPPLTRSDSGAGGSSSSGGPDSGLKDVEGGLVDGGSDGASDAGDGGDASDARAD